MGQAGPPRPWWSRAQWLYSGWLAAGVSLGAVVLPWHCWLTPSVLFSTSSDQPWEWNFPACTPVQVLFSAGEHIMGIPWLPKLLQWINRFLAGIRALGLISKKGFNVFLCESDPESEGLMALVRIGKALFFILSFCK